MNSPVQLRSRLDAWMNESGSHSDVETGGGGPYGGGMEPRVAKLEVTTEYIQRDVAEIKSDLKSMDSSLRSFGGEVNAEFKAIRSEARADFIKLFSALIVATLGLAALMAKGFHWI